MKLVTAIIKPQKLDEVKAALRAIGVRGITVSEVSGVGRQGGHVEVYRGAEYPIDLIQKIRFEILAENKDVAPIIDAIVKSATSPSRSAKRISSVIKSISLSEILPLPLRVAKAEENFSESDSNMARAY